MKKIMFNDRFGLTQAVLDGRKTMTRRAVPMHDYKYGFQVWYDRETKQCCVCDGSFILERSRYSRGEVVAIAQCYYDVYGYETCISERGEKDSGIFNKMFVRADSMPHHIKITNIRVERLQDISDEDCLKEGIYKHDPVHIVGYNHNFIAYSYDATKDPKLKKWWFRTPREAFTALIDKVSGKGTWQSNPLVWVYEFELVD